MNPSAASYLLIYGCPAYVVTAGRCAEKGRKLLGNYEEMWDILE